MSAWEPGQSGNVNGRPKGVGRRTRLVNKYVADTYDVWLRKGHQCLEKLADNDPGGFCRLVSLMVPKEELAKAVSHSIEITLKTPQWLNAMQHNETNDEAIAPDDTDLTPRLITNQAQDIDD